MKYRMNMNNNIDKYAAWQEEKSSWVLIAAAVIAVLIMLVISYIPAETESAVLESETIEAEMEAE